MSTKESQRDRILALLQKRGDRGVTNQELNEICFRFSGRIFELRLRGWDIETRPAGRGLFKFILHGKQPTLFPISASEAA